MGSGPPKPFRLLGGRPLVDHVIERLATGLDRVLVSAAPGGKWDWTGCEVVPDAGAPFGGPAVGIASAMHHLRRQHGARVFRLVTAPADAPFLPRDLAARLLDVERRTTVATFNSAWVPTCAVWRSEDGSDWDDVSGRSIRALLERCAAIEVPFSLAPDAPDGNPFFNVNTPDDLERAELQFGAG